MPIYYSQKHDSSHCCILNWVGPVLSCSRSNGCLKSSDVIAACLCEIGNTEAGYFTEWNGMCFPTMRKM